MGGIGITVILSMIIVLLLMRHWMLKREIKKLSRQIDRLAKGETEKILDISLVDRDLEDLAGALNRYYSTQRGTVASALRHEEYLKESIANISHDLRTPLTVITGHLQMLERTELDDGQRQRVDTALHKAERMKKLIGAFYELSLLENGNREPQEEKINLTNMLMDFLTENAPILEKQHIQPEVTLPEQSVFLYSDRGMMERILQNLLTNAVRYSDGQIRIRVGRENEKIILFMDNTVRDTSGIDTERIFERFYTGDHSRHNESTGLGLSIVKILVEKMGGKVSASVCDGLLSIKVEFADR